MSSGAKDRFERAEQAARKGNYEYAIELYLQGLTLDPKATVRRRLHDIETLSIQEQGGNPEGGVASKMKVMGALPKIKKLSLQSKWDEVVSEIEKVVRLTPRNTSLLFQLGEALLKIEAQDSALQVFEEVAGADKRNTDALRKLGQIWAAKDEIDKAVECWEKVRMIRPDDKEAAKAIRDLSAANMVRRAEERKSKSGDQSFQALLADDKKSAELEKQAKVLRTDEDREQAVQFKEEEIKKDPKNSRLYRELGALYQDLRKYKDAHAAYLKAIEVNPHDLFAKDKIGQLKEQVANEQIIILRKKVAEAEANGGAAEELKAELAKKERDVQNFKLKEYERRVKEHPTDYDLKVRFGQLLMQSGLYDQAIQQFQNSIKDPKFKVQSKHLMGVCFQKKGVHPVAISQFQDALQSVVDKDGDLAKEIRYDLGVAYQESGDRDAALKAFQSIMAVDIGYRDVSNRVADLMRV